MRTVRVFISSPGDVVVERQRAQRVIERLNGEYANVARFEAVRWETRFYGAHVDFQPQIVEARECDVVIGVLWSRLGTPLSDSFTSLIADEHAGGAVERYPSGTAYELLSSIFERKSREASGTSPGPDVYVFRKTAPAVIELGDSAGIDDAQQQWQLLEQFFERWFRGKDGVYKAAYHTFLGVDEFERATEGLLRAWVKDNLEGAAAVVWPATLGSPFRGLAAFDKTHARVYFGRDRKVGRAIELLRDAGAAAAASGPLQPGSRDRFSRPFLLIVGPSGSGKSSLMLAGLAPRLIEPGVVPGVEHWRAAVMRPSDGTNPFDALAKALLRDGTTGEDFGFGPAIPELAASRLLRDEPGRFDDAVVEALDAIGKQEGAAQGYERPLATNLLLLVDQLEDIFSTAITESQRAELAAVLAALTATRRVWVVATLRGDLYERLISERPWIALKDAGATYDLAPPGPEELEEIVRKSAAAAGLHYEVHPETGVRLDEQLLKDASGQDILPLLQFTLNRLFDERQIIDDTTLLTYKSYTSLGGLDGAIDQAAEKAIDALGESEKASLPRLLRLLAVPVAEGGEASGARASLTTRSVKSSDARRNDASARLADALVSARILLATRGDADGGAQIRVAHQRVFESWRRAKEIIADQRDFYRIRDDVEKQQQRWLTGKRVRQLLVPPGVAIAEAEKIATGYRDELPDHLLNFISASGRRARWRQRTLMAATLVFAVVAAVAGWSWNEASIAQISAERNYRTARDTVDGLIKSFAGRLSRMQGITVETVEAAFNEIGRSVHDLGVRAAATDPTFDKTRADLALAFAHTYKKVESPRAIEIADRGLKHFTELAKRYPGNVEYEFGISSAEELISDLKRTSDPVASREAAERALDIRGRLHAADQGNATLAIGLTRSLVRAGDLEKDFKRRTNLYDDALDLGLHWWERRPDDPDLHRELSWALNKHGDQFLRAGRSKAADANTTFAAELCLRRNLYERDNSDTLIQADVSWSLERLGRARQLLGDLVGAENAYIEAIGLRRELLKVDSSNEVWLRDLYIILTRYGLLQIDRDAADVAFVYLSEAQRFATQLRARKAWQSWLPPFAAGLEKARLEIGGAEADKALRELDAIIAAQEHPRLERLRKGRPSAAECWPKLTADLMLLAGARLPTASTGR